jgi:hypothetical protein
MIEMKPKAPIAAVAAVLFAAHPAISGPIGRHHDARSMVVDACRPDYWRYCTGVVPGRGRVLSCLVGSRDRLSPPCAHALAELFGHPTGYLEERWTGRFADEDRGGGEEDEGPLK